MNGDVERVKVFVPIREMCVCFFCFGMGVEEQWDGRRKLITFSGMFYWFCREVNNE